MTARKADVALFLPNLEGGGAERAAALLASALAERGYGVDMVLAQARGPFLARLSPRVCLVDLHARRLGTSVVGLVKYLRRERPGVLLSMTVVADLVALAASRLAHRDTRMVVWLENDLYSGYTRPQLWQGRLAVRLLPRMYRWADRLTAASRGVAESVARVSHLPVEAIRVIYNPVVTAEDLARAREPLEHPWFQEGQPPVVLGVGRLHPQKDFATLLRAFALVRRQREARLVLLGEGPQRAFLENLARELGVEAEVHMPGFVENPFQYMARAGVFVLSSAWEGFGNVVAEALACGCPVVSTRCPSGPAEILDDGRYGHLVPVGEPEPMAEAILRALAGDTKPADAAWLRRFTPSYVVERYVETLGLARNA
ncbi:MAG: glycosyltransferase [Chloroflexi bacterium]|nr:glycosyltransferase [Chloroflexota bacterium]